MGGRRGRARRARSAPHRGPRPTSDAASARTCSRGHSGASASASAPTPIGRSPPRRTHARENCSSAPATARCAATGAWCGRLTGGPSPQTRPPASTSGRLTSTGMPERSTPSTPIASNPSRTTCPSPTRCSSGHIRAHDVAPGLSLVAHDGERIVGFLLARRWQHEGSGYIDLLAVPPGHQRRGLGTALLTHGFGAFAAAGLVQAQLVVASDNPPRAARLRGRRDGAAVPLRRLRALHRTRLSAINNGDGRRLLAGSVSKNFAN